MRRPGTLARWAVLLLAVCAASCGGPRRKPTYPTEGRLLIGGQPTAGVTVFLHPVGSTEQEPTRAYATTELDGGFSLTTYAAGDGAPEGEYIVTLLYEPLNSPLGKARGKAPMINGRYTRPDTSPLRAKVEKKAKNVLAAFEVQ